MCQLFKKKPLKIQKGPLGLLQQQEPEQRALTKVLWDCCYYTPEAEFDFGDTFSCARGGFPNLHKYIAIAVDQHLLSRACGKVIKQTDKINVFLTEYNHFLLDFFAFLVSLIFSKLAFLVGDLVFLVTKHTVMKPLLPQHPQGRSEHKDKPSPIILT